MQYIIGIDGGGTKTRLVMTDMQDKLLVTCEAGPSNIHSAPINEVKKVLYTLIQRALDKTGMNLSQCASVCIGAAGAGRFKERIILETILNEIGLNGKKTVTDDVETAFYGGVGCSTGSVIIAGTGSIGFGRNSKGRTHRCGGWGHIIGDEGSGYDIGKKVISSVMRSFDGRSPQTIMTKLLLNSLSLSDHNELIQYIYRSNIGKKEIASLSRVAYEGCAAGDEIAYSIVKNTAEELYLIATTVLERLGQEDGLLATGGGVLTHNDYIRNEFKHLLDQSYPKVQVIPMKRDAAWGAAMIAKEKTEY
ncbi:BadF/BadG/BcrA/BcrD ATPase family protein [Gottfriedia sp. NPDC056225]|uniref:BadF/BadG/BcrA/BcrD ATPase family protein n=1 Tax=Gottfriedia sp. NPDC056225 TaxID=3345751 RepID=UPI001559F177|nr:transcriptional regulator [Arthrobacter citreus]